MLANWRALKVDTLYALAEVEANRDSVEFVVRDLNGYTLVFLKEST
jgi:hypothetical protein